MQPCAFLTQQTSCISKLSRQAAGADLPLLLQADVPHVSERALRIACTILDCAGPRLDGDLAVHWDPDNPEARARSRRRMDQWLSRLWLFADIRTVGLSEDIQDTLHVRPQALINEACLLAGCSVLAAAAVPLSESAMLKLQQ